jgi:hypothetical protein
MPARHEHRHIIYLGRSAPFSSAPHPSNGPAPRRFWDARPLVLAALLLIVSLVAFGLLLGAL